MNGQIDIYGVFVPSLLVLAIVAYVLNRLASRLIARVGIYRHVWHRPLFDLALYVLILGLLVHLAKG
ncbi:DUF1656 domain-containing protein [Haematobacter missouriensis]|uniref:DUF1656 domain-containing protein n=1 Tax=Haematobacter missouriensis TaxID=366616 RepID=A0A212AI97_9RHOB|nr:DUF1656 domain-containing protein [Haematobacter missouriensis]OWJ77794.1 hypothetical protein CDV53_04700 [Haematobacter missouriensis]OWJ81214.1 hypothetical protein CDV52_19145 [Haematobacter missouriensis]